MERQWNSAVRRVLPLILGFAAALAPSSPTRAFEIALRWTSVPGIDGYRLHIGRASRQYAERIDLGSLAGSTVNTVVHFHLTGLEVDTPYFMAVTAYNAAGESAYSNEKQVQFEAFDVPPVANAGPDRAATVGRALLLGKAPQPGISYIWFQSVGPPALLDPRTSSTTSFTPRVPGTFEFVQVAFDAVGLASSDAVTIVVTKPATTPATITPTRPPTTPTTRPTLKASATLTRSPTRTPTSTRFLTASSTRTPTATSTRTPRPTRTPTSTHFPTPSRTPTASATSTRTRRPRGTPTYPTSQTAIASPSPRAQIDPTSSVTPTFTATSTPFAVRSLLPTSGATAAPSASASPHSPDVRTGSPTSADTSRTSTPVPVSTQPLTATSTPLPTSPPSPTGSAAVPPHATRTGTPVLTPTPTRSPTETPTPTDTPESPRTADPTLTPTVPGPSLVTPNAACPKTINGDSVTIALLVTTVDILLDEHPLESCPVLDLDRDGALRLHEVVRLVAIALGEVSWLPSAGNPAPSSIAHGND